MKRIIAIVVVLAGLAAAVPAPALAQEKPQVPLKVDLVISRQAGARKVSSMPYSLWVTANAERGRETSLRMGVQVPVVQTVFGASKEGSNTSVPQQSYTYRNVGTNIDCSATTAADGRYSVAITLSESGLQTEREDSKPIAPAFREFTSRFFLLLKDGQTATYTSATDPVTGETLKVDVTLTVLK